MSARERDALNAAQARAFAELHGLPLVRWKRPIAGKAGSAFSARELDRLYEAEPGMWGYFVRRASFWG